MAEPGELRVDYDDVGTTLETLREAASNFEEANEKAFADNLADMQAMNSECILKKQINARRWDYVQDIVSECNRQIEVLYSLTFE